MKAILKNDCNALWVTKSAPVVHVDCKYWGGNKVELASCEEQKKQQPQTALPPPLPLVPHPGNQHSCDLPSSCLNVSAFFESPWQHIIHRPQEERTFLSDGFKLSSNDIFGSIQLQPELQLVACLFVWCLFDCLIRH